MLAEQLKPASDVDSLDFYRAPSWAPSPYMFHFRPVTATLRARSRASLRDQRGQIYVAPIAGTREHGKDAIKTLRSSASCSMTKRDQPS